MLDDVCDFDIEVVLTDKNDVIFKIIKDGIASNLSGASGFERTASALALRCVLGNISTMPRPNFITLDEILGKVSKDNYENIRNVYKKMEKNYQFILHISHIEDIKDWHSNIISISKISNISSIKTEIK
jgi:DNA repair exonuclease SbcCD ATPase subunit